MPATLVHNHRIILVSSPLLVYKWPLQQWEELAPTIHQYLFNCSFPAYKYNSMLTLCPDGKQLHQQEYSFLCNSFAFSFTIPLIFFSFFFFNSTHFQSYLGHHLFPHPTSVRHFNAFVIQIILWQSIFYPGIPWLPNWFFKNLCVLVPLCALKFYAFW